MDRGIPTEAILREMREPGREMFYLVGTPKGRINKHEKKWLDLPSQQVRESVQVKPMSTRASCMYWRGAMGARRRKSRCGASDWRG
jgi:hypothetical protein